MINANKSTLNKKIEILDLGMQAYKESWIFQKELLNKRSNNEINDTLIFVEHEPVYTLGKNADENHILQNYPENVQTFHIERGGDVTFHGPGQLVGYPILDLRNYKKSISWYMRSLEEVIIDTLLEFNIKAVRKDRLTGVWYKDEKIAALGVRVSKWITMHGFSLNINPDLNYYKSIIPCGIFEYGVTSMSKILDKNIDLELVKGILKIKFLDQFNNNHLTNK
ncbi:MAG: lipoyl(octanoyl) transferase LipB [Candidatus Neomarinimicrobiota bacterium]|nr:MAG: lipoyl(octanoyl) transferase LipB [bacterium]|tara:strand:- start:117 stop:785 length:669 start_codon:yes stop_codon:yes gene_type:complete